MSPLAILKLLKAAKQIREYVVKDNELDMQLGSIRARLDKIEQQLIHCIKTNIGEK
tara:strand:- start:349 stop:516 length:168 start_codon:yes stop_codon:yes gene_type:complete